MIIGVVKCDESNILSRYGDNEDEEVRFHSGDYLITSVQWSLTRSECNTNITAMKDSVPNRFETAKVDYDGSIKYVSG